MYIYMYITLTLTFTFTYIRTYLHTYIVWLHVYIYIYAWMHVYMFTYSPVYAFTMYVHMSTQYIRHVLATCHGKAQPSFRTLGFQRHPRRMQVKHPMHKTSVSFLPVYPTKLPLRTLSQNALVANCQLDLAEKKISSQRRAIWSVGPQSSL